MRSAELLLDAVAPATDGSPCWIIWSRIWALIDRARSISNTATITARRSSFVASVGAVSHSEPLSRSRSNYLRFISGCSVDTCTKNCARLTNRTGFRIIEVDRNCGTGGMVLPCRSI